MEYCDIILTYESNCRNREYIESQSKCKQTPLPEFMNNPNVFLGNSWSTNIDLEQNKNSPVLMPDMFRNRETLSDCGLIVHPTLGWLCFRPLAFVKDPINSEKKVLIVTKSRDAYRFVKLASYAAFLCQEKANGCVLIFLNDDNSVFKKISMQITCAWLFSEFPKIVFEFQNTYIPMQLSKANSVIWRDMMCLRNNENGLFCLETNNMNIFDFDLTFKETNNALASKILT